MFARTKIAVAATLIVGAASATLAKDSDESVSAVQAARESQGNPLPWWWQGQHATGNPGSAYAFVPENRKPASWDR